MYATGASGDRRPRETGLGMASSTANGSADPERSSPDRQRPEEVDRFGFERPALVRPPLCRPAMKSVVRLSGP